MAKIQNHVAGTVDNLRDSDGNVHEINAAYLDGKGAEKYVTTDTEQNISAKKTFDTTPVLSKIKGAKVIGTDANGLMEAHTLGIGDITNLQAGLDGKASPSDIGNGTITIQKNGTNVGNFTTNQSGNKNINLTLTKNDVGLGNVDNTADSQKSVSYADNAGGVMQNGTGIAFEGI